MSRRNGNQIMDHGTSIAVCLGIGETLRRAAAVDPSDMPDRLRDLLDQLQRRDGDTRQH